MLTLIYKSYLCNFKNIWYADLKYLLSQFVLLTFVIFKQSFSTVSMIRKYNCKQNE